MELETIYVNMDDYGLSNGTEHSTIYPNDTWTLPCGPFVATNANSTFTIGVENGKRKYDSSLYHAKLLRCW